MRRLLGFFVVLLVLSVGGCRKAPLFDVAAGFVLADASWFAEEQTLFVFYEVTAEQGLGDPSVIELAYTTDTERVDWTPLSDFEMVHTHEPVDCGNQALCGSASVHVPDRPRFVQLRLRYHRDGVLSLGARTVFNVVEAGAPHTSRSLLVYGVFDGINEHIQWRARHRFPTLRNEQATALGLRRTFVVREPRYGSSLPLATELNPYGYGVACPEDDTYVRYEAEEVQTTERAVFHPDPIPLGASAATTVCAEATVTDATGTFTTGAIARKNPEVRPAFPVLRSPIRDATPLKFFLAPCEREISPEHEEMQRQRLQMENLPTTCIDDWQSPLFVHELEILFRDAVEAARPAGDDMVLVIALHRDEEGVVDVVEEALLAVAPGERHRSSPRLAGAFVLDSEIRGLEAEALAPVTLWCPSTLPLDELPDASTRTCAVLPDNLTFEFGPFAFGEIPILPSRTQYLDFIDTFSKQQAGWVESLSYRAPQFATTSDHIDLGAFGVVTFLNGEAIDAAPDDAFSYCVDNDPQLVVFRSDFMQGPPPPTVVCDQLGIAEDVCAGAQLGAAPLSTMGDWHALFGEDRYELGIFWEFPFLLRMEYELVAAGSVSAFGFSVPFGFANDGESYYGTEVWTADEYVLDDVLTQCTRFCDHPTFDSAGVYHVTDDFRSTYARSCYLPDYPSPGDSGFPLDP